MAIEVSLSDDAAWVLNKAKVFLGSKPVHHNVILTLLHARVAEHIYFLKLIIRTHYETFCAGKNLPVR